MSNAAPDFSFDVVLLKRDEFRRGGLLLPRPACGRAIAYGIFLCVTFQCVVPANAGTRRGLSFRHWSRGRFSLFRPGVMGPCVRRDDLLRDPTRPQLYQRAAEVGHMR